MLRLDQVHIHYGLSHVLQGVSLQVGAGEIVGLFGRNGVGKTTVMKTVAGWVQPSAGQVLLAGQPINGQTPDQICRSGIGFVPEDRRIFPGLTVAENLQLGQLQAPRRSRAAHRARMDWVLGLFPRLRERLAQMGTTLSGGEQQMLAIARVLAGEPKLLLIDEPTEGLAPIIVEELFAVMTQLGKEGIPILLVEQNVHRALRITQRFYALERGTVVLEGDARDATQREALMRVLAV